MRDTFLKTIGTTALTLLLLATFAQIPASAQGKSNEEESGARTQETSSKHPTRALEGSWNSQVTLRNCQTGAALFTFPAMQTYMRGGTMQDFAPEAPPLTRGPGHGVWSHQSGRLYSAAFQFFRFNADGTLAGTLKAKLQNTLSASGSSFTTAATIEVFDPGGNLIGTGCATGISTRFE